MKFDYKRQGWLGENHPLIVTSNAGCCCWLRRSRKRRIRNIVRKLYALFNVYLFPTVFSWFWLLSWSFWIIAYWLSSLPVCVNIYLIYLSFLLYSLSLPMWIIIITVESVTLIFTRNEQRERGRVFRFHLLLLMFSCHLLKFLIWLRRKKVFHSDQCIWW